MRIRAILFACLVTTLGTIAARAQYRMEPYDPATMQ